MKMIYLACPYTHPDIEVRAKRLQAADYYAALLIETGIGAVFSPITHGVRLEPYMSRAKVESHEFWMGQCFAVLRKCDELVVLPIEGYELSKGVQMEYDFAVAHKMPIRFLQGQGLPNLRYEPEISIWL